MAGREVTNLGPLNLLTSARDDYAPSNTEILGATLACRRNVVCMHDCRGRLGFA